MIPFQVNVDIIDELEKTFPSYSLTTPSFVVNELIGLKKNLKGKDRVAAGISLKIVNSSVVKVKNISLNQGESVDDALLRISNVLATNDIDLKNRAREKGITVIYLRQKKYLAFDGHLDWWYVILIMAIINIY